LPELPLQSPSASRIRLASLKLLADGSVTANVEELRWGGFAAETRAAYRLTEGPSHSKIMESFIAKSIGYFNFIGGNPHNLDGNNELRVNYTFAAPGYRKIVGP
jgi:hypothetical protein